MHGMEGMAQAIIGFFILLPIVLVVVATIALGYFGYKLYNKRKGNIVENK